MLRNMKPVKQKKISNEIKDEIMKHQSALNVRDCATKEIN